MPRKKEKDKERDDAVANTRNYVLAVCALLGGADYILFDKIDQYPFAKFSITAFSISIFIALVHIGYLYWDELYGKNQPEGNEKFLSFRVRAQFSLALFLILIALGLAALILNVLLA